MGIRNLLQAVKEAIREKQSLSKYAGKKIGIDLYSWIYRYVQTRGQEEMLNEHLGSRYVRYCVNRIQKLLNHGIKVVVVADGARLKFKDQEHNSRRQARQNWKEKGNNFLREGQQDLAKEAFAKAFHVTPEVAYPILVALKEINVPFMVAPYEADAQLAYLSRSGFIDAVLTEDSDLLVFGARCVLLKVDFKNMVADQLLLDDIPKACPKFKRWTHCGFIAACILSGCDYLSNLHGVGLATAMSAIEKTGSLQNALVYLVNKYGGGTMSTDQYVRLLVQAFLAFRFQRVYCPRTEKCVALNPQDIQKLSSHFLENYERKFEDMDHREIPWSEEVLDLFVLSQLTTKQFDMSLYGRQYIDQDIRAIAQGEIHPVTLTPYSHLKIQHGNNHNFNYWCGPKPIANKQVRSEIIQCKPHPPADRGTSEDDGPKRTQDDNFEQDNRQSRFELHKIHGSRSPIPASQQVLYLQPPVAFSQLFKSKPLLGKRSVPVKNLYHV